MERNLPLELFRWIYAEATSLRTNDPVELVRHYKDITAAVESAGSYAELALDLIMAAGNGYTPNDRHALFVGAAEQLKSSQ